MARKQRWKEDASEKQSSSKDSEILQGSLGSEPSSDAASDRPLDLHADLSETDTPNVASINTEDGQKSNLTQNVQTLSSEKRSKPSLLKNADSSVECTLEPTTGKGVTPKGSGKKRRSRIAANFGSSVDS